MAQRQQSPDGVYSSPGRLWLPPPALTGFLVLLALMFTASYGVGSLAGPVAPGMHPGGGGPGPVVGDLPGTGRHGHGGAPAAPSGGGR
ncbi:hypothetical protein [Streptomyces sp. NBC_01408]|uniref:hypothetical protein n=1 Tax=Streptomyces sp. NBC_01408 TaxID=2903855 RepID=UPI00224EC882|nr:hypothetical protein [Streptomyces sp. NBC_01408]MCX4694763.1 hypothetical protein [Streptomyces sp. NBC_01408]